MTLTALSRLLGAGSLGESSQLTRTLLQFFEANKLSSRRLSAGIRGYAVAVEALGDPRQGSIFADQVPPSREQLWQDATRSFAAAPRADGDWQSFPASSGTLGLPRAEMPQVPTEARGALTNFLIARGITSTPESVAASSLKATQAEFSPEKVRRSRAKTLSRRVLVSSDGYVIDGHHQWRAAVEDDQPLNILRLSVPIRSALAAIDAFPSTQTPRLSSTRYETEEYPYLGVASEDWRQSADPEAAVVNPIDPALSPDAKVDALNALSDANIGLVEAVLRDLSSQLGLTGKWSKKLPERIQAKASRPTIRRSKPWHDVEHIRDGLRFKVRKSTQKPVPLPGLKQVRTELQSIWPFPIQS